MMTIGSQKKSEDEVLSACADATEAKALSSLMGVRDEEEMEPQASGKWTDRSITQSGNSSIR